MLRAPSGLSVRDSFIARVIAGRSAFAVSGEEGLARVPSQARTDRHVTLLWSDLAEAKRWAAAIAKGPRIKQLTLRDLLAEVLPRLADLKRLVGPDWSSEPVEPELDALDMARRLRVAMVEVTIGQAIAQGHVWVLTGIDGPLRFVSRSSDTTLVLPFWSDVASAQARAEGPFENALAGRIAIEDFRQRTLMWAAETRTRIAPGFCEGPGLIELDVADAKARLKAGASPRSTAA
jgi:hypothetical protein